jgi:hypothetical protein
MMLIGLMIQPSALESAIGQQFASAKRAGSLTQLWFDADIFARPATLLVVLRRCGLHPARPLHLSCTLERFGHTRLQIQHVAPAAHCPNVEELPHLAAGGLYILGSV